MPRIAGIDIPERKQIRYSLRYIHGIGPRFADAILEEAGVDPTKKANELTDQEVAWFIEHGAALTPDTVLLFAYENDIYYCGEQRYTRWEFRDILDQNAVGIIQPDICHVA